MSDTTATPVQTSSSSDSAPVIPIQAVPGPVVGAPTPASSVANDTPKPGSREAKKKAKEAKKKAKAEARAQAKTARQEARDAKKLAKQKAREEKRALAEAARLSKKQSKPVRTESAPELWRATYQALATQASQVDDPFVAAVLKECERDFATFERDMTEQPVSAQKLEALKSARQNLFTVFTEDLGLLTKGLESIRGGEEFVAAARADDPETMARHLLSRMTPKHLGHNAPLLEAMKKSMEEYLEVDRDYGDLQRATDLTTAHIADGKRLVQLAVTTLQSTIKAAQARKAQAEERKAQAERRREEAKSVKAA